MSNELRRWMTLVEAQKTYYIRLGDIPEGERSRIGAAPNHIAARYQTSDHEKGVSVFDTQWNETLKRWAIINVGNFASLDELFTQQRPAYLVTGKRQRSTGIDGESLLRSVIIAKQLAYNELCVAGWGNDPMPEDYLD